MARNSVPSKAQMDTHLLMEAIIAATSVISLSSSLAGLWMAKKATGKAVGEVKDVTEDPAGKTTATVGRMAGRVKKASQVAYDDDSDEQGDEDGEGAENAYDEDDEDDED